MQWLMRKLSLMFAAGAFGVVANSLVAWGCDVSGLASLGGLGIAPTITPAGLYPRIVWGGIWGLAFFLPLPFPKSKWLIRGALLSLAPTAAQLVGILPANTQPGALGLDAGRLTPLLVAAFNVVWGMAAAGWLRSKHRDD